MLKVGHRDLDPGFLCQALCTLLQVPLEPATDTPLEMMNVGLLGLGRAWLGTRAMPRPRGCPTSWRGPCAWCAMRVRSQIRLRCWQAARPHSFAHDGGAPRGRGCSTSWARPCLLAGLQMHAQASGGAKLDWRVHERSKGLRFREMHAGASVASQVCLIIGRRRKVTARFRGPALPADPSVHMRRSSYRARLTCSACFSCVVVQGSQAPGALTLTQPGGPSTPSGGGGARATRSPSPTSTLCCSCRRCAA